ncbi:MAG: glucan 1,3-beta-glucosidase, partial [Planctomycetes bacterium]|nr:glucan 1,3-beta-glucosidase [Planctomycetota bacterium]
MSPTSDLSGSENQKRALRGVNLGNWLLLEKWMRPSLFEGTSAVDEYTLCLELGQAAESHLLQHRDTSINEEDFIWLS